MILNELVAHRLIVRPTLPLNTSAALAPLNKNGYGLSAGVGSRAGASEEIDPIKD